MTPPVQAIAFGVPAIAYAWAAFEYARERSLLKIVWFAIPCSFACVVCAAAAVGVIDA